MYLRRYFLCQEFPTITLWSGKDFVIVEPDSSTDKIWRSRGYSDKQLKNQSKEKGLAGILSPKESMEMLKSVIYTSIFGKYDKLIDPSIYSKELDYICFTDNPNLKSNVWEVQVIKPHVLGDSCRSARYVKINAHKFLSDYKYSMYVDGNILIKSIPNIPNILGNYKLAIGTHPSRDCIYDEAIACKRLGKDDPAIIDLQMSVYKKMRFPEHDGLFNTSFHCKQHNDPEIIKRCELWWSQIVQYSLRDQLSFTVVFRGYPIRSLSVKDRNKYVHTMRLHPHPYKGEV